MRHYDKLIFVTKSDTTTGPMAEAIMQRELMLEDILISSKGLVVLFPEPINPKAAAVLASHKLFVKDRTSEQLSEADFDERTLILVLDKASLTILEKDRPNEENIFFLPDYIQSDDEIIEPYGGSLADYNRCFEQLEIQVRRVVQILRTVESIPLNEAKP